MHETIEALMHTKLNTLILSQKLACIRIYTLNQY